MCRGAWRPRGSDGHWARVDVAVPPSVAPLKQLMVQLLISTQLSFKRSRGKPPHKGKAEFCREIADRAPAKTAHSQGSGSSPSTTPCCGLSALSSSRSTKSGPPTSMPIKSRNARMRDPLATQFPDAPLGTPNSRQLTVNFKILSVASPSCDLLPPLCPCRAPRI